MTVLKLKMDDEPIASLSALIADTERILASSGGFFGSQDNSESDSSLSESGWLFFQIELLSYYKLGINYCCL